MSIQHQTSDFTDNGLLEKLGKIFDQFFSALMLQHHIPGLAFAIVYKDKVLYEKGYGYANIENKILVDSTNTIFRIASISKLFTTIAILQLIERGVLKLDDEVNPYLKKINVTLSHPIKIFHLLNSTDGFEERLQRIITSDPLSIASLQTILARELIDTNIEPGKYITYGSWGMVVLSYVVEEVTKVPFAEYVDHFVFKHFGLYHSTALQPLPNELAKNLATTYLYSNTHERYQSLPITYVNTVASGGMSASVSDLAKFMSILFNGKHFPQMFKQQFTMSPQIPGVTLGFLEHWQNDKKALISDGSGIGVRSRMLLIPEDKLGFVFAANTRGEDFCQDLTKEFFNVFYKKTNTAPIQTNIFTSLNCNEFKGYYRYLQYNRSSFAKIFGLLANNLRVTATPTQGNLVVTPLLPFADCYGDFTKQTKLIAIGADVFQRENSDDLIFLYEEEKSHGNKYLFSGSGYHGCYIKLRWYENPLLHQVLFLLATLTFIGIFCSGFARYLFKTGPLLKPLNYLWPIPAFISLLNLFLIENLYYYLLQTKMGFPLMAFIDSRPNLLYLGFAAGILAAILSIILFIFLLFSQILLHFDLVTFCYFVSFIFASLIFMWLGYYWNFYKWHNFYGFDLAHFWQLLTVKSQKMRETVLLICFSLEKLFRKIIPYLEDSSNYILEQSKKIWKIIGSYLQTTSYWEREEKLILQIKRATYKVAQFIDKLFSKQK